MNEDFLLPILGGIVLFFILILGIFSLKIILFPNKTYKEQEQESKDEIEQALNQFIPTLETKNESHKKILEMVDLNIKTLKETEMNELTIIKEELLYQKLKIDENLKIKFETLKKEQQQECLITYFEIIKKHINNLSYDEIKEMLEYIDTKF